MQRQEQVLERIARIARCGYDFFVSVYPRVQDPEVRTAFAYIADVKNRFLVDLAPWLANVEHDEQDSISPTAIIARMYADLTRNFSGAAPAVSANALSFAEEQLLRLIERGFENASVPALKDLFKTYYPQLIVCRDAMRRLRERIAA